MPIKTASKNGLTPEEYVEFTAAGAAFALKSAGVDDAKVQTILPVYKKAIAHGDALVTKEREVILDYAKEVKQTKPA